MTSPPSVKKGSKQMPADTATTESNGFSPAERAAMKKRAAELRAEGKKGAKKADGPPPEPVFAARAAPRPTPLRSTDAQPALKRRLTT